MPHAVLNPGEADGAKDAVSEQAVDCADDGGLFDFYFAQCP